jgi:hypothetical protein
VFTKPNDNHLVFKSAAIQNVPRMLHNWRHGDVLYWRKKRRSCLRITMSAMQQLGNPFHIYIILYTKLWGIPSHQLIFWSALCRHHYGDFYALWSSQVWNNRQNQKMSWTFQLLWHLKLVYFLQTTVIITPSVNSTYNSDINSASLVMMVQMSTDMTGIPTASGRRLFQSFLLLICLIFSYL